VPRPACAYFIDSALNDCPKRPFPEGCILTYIESDTTTFGMCYQTLDGIHVSSLKTSRRKLEG